MKLRLFYIGINHKSAPYSVRERLFTSAGDKRVALAWLGDLARERMILSTCERFEIYALTAHCKASRWVVPLAQWFGVSGDTLAQYVHLLHGDAVAEHLLRVAAGLESRIIGEPHVLGQVRDAFLEATSTVQANGAGGTGGTRPVGPILDALARSAIHAGKRVRNETPINVDARSVVTIGLKQIERTLGTVRGRTILIVGTGRLAGDIAVALASRQAGRIIIVSRSVDRASALARKFHGVGLGFEQLTEGLVQSDAVVTCSRAGVVIDQSRVDEVAGRKLCILDLGVPRNVHTSVGQVRGVRLSHIDELLSSESTRPASREANHIVAVELARFLRWQREREVAPIIAEQVRRLRAHDVPDARTRNRALHAQIMRIKTGVAA